jgi:LCP family protein required for cell wall assembly
MIRICLLVLAVAACSDPSSPRPEDAPKKTVEEVEPVAPVAPTAASPASPEPPPPREEREGVEYLLLLGIDRSSSGIGRTDAILIVALDHDTGALGVISVPRDLWVDIPGMEPGRINKVYRWGDRKLGAGKGIPLLVRVIKQELGITVSHTAAADFAGFTRIVDTLGGIDVEVRCPIKDCFHSPVEGAPCIPLSLAAGTRRLDGTKALLFARSRHGRTDLDRARRQQAVLLGLWNKLKRLDTLLKLPALYRDLESHVTTDLDLEAVVRLVAFAARARLDSLHGLLLRPPLVKGIRTAEGKQVLALDGPAFQAALSRLFTAPPPGDRRGRACPKPDVGLRWRERLE